MTEAISTPPEKFENASFSTVRSTVHTNESQMRENGKRLN